MKRNKILTVILGIAIFSGVLCSGAVIVQGIQAGKNLPRHTTSSQKEQIAIPQAWELEKTKLEEFSEASISIDYCDFSILPADGYYLEYRLDGACTEPQYNSSDGIFYFEEGKTQLRYSTGLHLFFNTGNSSANRGPYYINLYVPKDQYFNLLKIKNESGNIYLEDVDAEIAELNADYGTLTLRSFTGKNISIFAESGNLEIGDVTCDNLEITNEYGDICGGSFKISDQAAIKLESGSLELSSLETDFLSLRNEYGNCSMDQASITDSEIFIESGNLVFQDAELETTDIDSSYGDVTLHLADDISDYNYDLYAEYGSIKLRNETLKFDEDEEIHYQKDNQKKKEIRISCESGNIKIR